MPGWVVCAECNTRYETEALGFCPRCGSRAKEGESPVATVGPIRRDPARMRLQLGGVLLLLMGLLFLVAVVVTMLNPAWSETQSFAYWSGPQEDMNATAGTIIVLATDAGKPLVGANVTISSGNRTVASGVTDPAGRYELQLRGYIAVNLTLASGGNSWTRHVLAPSGSTIEVHVDVTDAAVSDRVEGPDNLLVATTVAGFTMTILLALGGLAAVLVKWRGLALAGPIPMVAFLALLIVPFGMAGLFFFALVGTPYALVVSGRSAFPRR